MFYLYLLAKNLDNLPILILKEISKESILNCINIADKRFNRPT